MVSQVKEGVSAKITAVGNDEKSFHDHLNSKGLQIGDSITVKKKELSDGSMVIVMRSKKETILSHQVAERISVELSYWQHDKSF